MRVSSGGNNLESIDVDSSGNLYSNDKRRLNASRGNSTNTTFTGFWAAAENKLLTHCGRDASKLILQNRAVIVAVTCIFLYYCLGIAYYASVENWSFSLCFYFITVSLSVNASSVFISS